MTQPPTAARVSLRTVAKSLGLSHSTVSRALRDSPRVSEELKKQIREKAAALGYQPDPMLTALAHYRQGRAPVSLHSAIAWINQWPEPGQLYKFEEFKQYWQGASATAAKFGYRLDEFAVKDHDSFAHMQKVLLARNVRGVLLAPAPRPLVMDWSETSWERFSVVRFGRGRSGGPRFHIVTASQTSDSVLAFQEIQKRGYKRIGFVSEPSDHVLFLGGFLMAQFKADAADRVPPLLLPRTVEEEHEELFLQWLEKTNPDAILTDKASLRRMLDKAGYSVPSRVGLAVTSVLDGNADAGIFQNPQEIGKVAMDTLVALINNNERGVPKIPREVLVSGRWQDGATLPRR